MEFLEESSGELIKDYKVNSNIFLTLVCNLNKKLSCTMHLNMDSHIFYRISAERQLKRSRLTSPEDLCLPHKWRRWRCIWRWCVDCCWRDWGTWQLWKYCKGLAHFSHPKIKFLSSSTHPNADRTDVLSTFMHFWKFAKMFVSYKTLGDGNLASDIQKICHESKNFSILLIWSNPSVLQLTHS